MEFPKWKKKLNIILTSLDRVVSFSKNILVGAGAITLASGQPLAQSKMPGNELILQSNDIKKFSSKFLLKAATKTGLSTMWAQHRSHSSHSSHRSHSSHSSHASHYSSSSPSHYSSSGPVYTPPSPKGSTTPKTPPPRTAAPSVSYNDDFSAASRSSVRWINGAPSSGAAPDTSVSVARRNGRLEITPRSGVSGKHYNGYVSETPFDMTGKGVSVEVVQAAAEQASAVFALLIDSNNWYRFAKEGSTLIFESNMGGMKASANIAYDSTEHRFWRFRHDSASEILYWETSGDGVRWNVRHASSAKIPVESLYVELSAGTRQPITGPGTTAFDNFRIVTLQ